jgi:predicted small secreted protein
MIKKIAVILVIVSILLSGCAAASQNSRLPEPGVVTGCNRMRLLRSVIEAPRL